MAWFWTALLMKKIYGSERGNNLPEVTQQIIGRVQSGDLRLLLTSLGL